MRSFKDGRWVRLTAGDYVMHTWTGEDQLTYRATRVAKGWVLRRSVAGATSTYYAVGSRPFDTLRDAVAMAATDIETAAL